MKTGQERRGRSFPTISQPFRRLLDWIADRLGYQRKPDPMHVWHLFQMTDESFKLGEHRGYWDHQGNIDWTKLGHDLGLATTSYADRRDRGL